MTDRPIIFSGPMVQALIDGRKTQTRQVLKPQPVDDAKFVTVASNGSGWAAFDNLGYGFAVLVPYAPGDRLWVREAWKKIPESRPGGYFVPGSPFYGVNTFYRADNCCPLWANGPWHSPQRMGRPRSRLTLTVTDVRVQRLQEISEDDARAEGCGWSEDWEGFTPFPEPGDGRYYSSRSAISSFDQLWCSIHGPDAWDANPWVCALTFTVERRNIDQ